MLSMTSRWSAATGAARGASYAARFDQLAAAGHDVHGEASLCASLVPPGSRVLDAGCGTGRVALRLLELGYDCTGVDLDEHMLAVARERAPDRRWITADLSSPALAERLGRGAFDLVVAAGNVVPLVAEGTEAAVVANLAAVLAPGGRLVAGFGLDAAHLPSGAALVDLAEYDEWCAAAGLEREARYATWEREAYTGGGYAVNVHRAG